MMSAVLVDPSEDALSMVAKNLIYNHISHDVSFYPAFVSDKEDKEVVFYGNGHGAASSMYTSHAKTAKSKSELRKVKTVSVDYLSAILNLIPDLVKIDVEGAELQVLDGSINLASQKSTKFFIEMHKLDERPMKESGDYVLNWCKENGYVPYYLTNHEELVSGETIASRGKCHLLLMPKGIEYPEKLKSIAPYTAL